MYFTKKAKKYAPAAHTAKFPGYCNHPVDPANSPLYIGYNKATT